MFVFLKILKILDATSWDIQNFSTHCVNVHIHKYLYNSISVNNTYLFVNKSVRLLKYILEINTMKLRERSVTTDDVKTDISRTTLESTSAAKKLKRNRKSENDEASESGNEKADSLTFSTLDYTFKKPNFLSSPKINSNTPSIEKLDKQCTNLKTLIALQTNTYYKDLNCPKFMGTENYEILRLPSDVKLFSTITTQLENLVNMCQSSYNESDNDFKTNTMLNVDTGRNITIYDLAKLHQIDISDIKDTIIASNYSDRLNLKVINRILDKPLIRNKDSRIRWPAKPKRKKIKKSEEDDGISSERTTSKNINEISWLS